MSNVPYRWVVAAGYRGRVDFQLLRFAAPAAGHSPGHLAVVSEAGPAGLVTTAAGSFRAALGRRYGPSLVLPEHTRRQAPQGSEH